MSIRTWLHASFAGALVLSTLTAAPALAQTADPGPDVHGHGRGHGHGHGCAEVADQSRGIVQTWSPTRTPMASAASPGTVTSPPARTATVRTPRT